MERETAERGSLRAGGSWGEVQTPEDVETMRRLRGLGWGRGDYGTGPRRRVSRRAWRRRRGPARSHLRG